MKYLIIAGNAGQAANLARGMGWVAPDWKYFDRPETLLACDRSSIVVIWYGDWYQRIGELQLQEVLETIRARRIPQFTIGEMR